MSINAATSQLWHDRMDSKYHKIGFIILMAFDWEVNHFENSSQLVKIACASLIQKAHCKNDLVKIEGVAS